MPKKYRPTFLCLSDSGASRIPIDGVRLHRWYNVMTKGDAYGIEVRVKKDKTWAHVAYFCGIAALPEIELYKEEANALQRIEVIKAKIREATNEPSL